MSLALTADQRAQDREPMHTWLCILNLCLLAVAGLAACA